MRKPPFNKIMTYEDERTIVSLYKDGLSASKICSELNNKFKTTKSIYDVLRKYDVIGRTSETCRDPNLNHSYFESIDTPSKAYLLGLMISDGWVSKAQKNSEFLVTKREQVAFSLSEEDRYLVEWVKSEWNSQNKINIIKKKVDTIFPNGKIYESCVMSRIMVSSRKMYEDLNRLGVDTNKSIVSILPIISNDLYSHLLRGIVDGDGTIGVYDFGSKKQYMSIKFLGSASLMAQISWFLKKQLNLSYLKPNWKKESKTLSSMDYMIPEEADALFCYLYKNKDQAQYLKRKYLIGENFINNQPKE